MFIALPSFSPDHIHPMLVNFTAALLPVSFASDVLGRVFSKQSLHAAAWWALAYATAITPFTALAGLIWKQHLGAAQASPDLILHQWFGISLAVCFVVLTYWRWQSYRQDIAPSTPYLVFAFVVVLALAFQGNLGGVIVFGP